MKKVFFGVLVSTLALAMIMGTASPVAAEGGWTLTMATVANGSGGVIVTFDVEGTPPPSVSTMAYVGWSGAYPMYCNYSSNHDLLICKIQGGIRRNAGKSAYFELWGQPFTISIPQKPEDRCVSVTFEIPENGFAKFSTYGDIQLIKSNQCLQTSTG